MANPGTRFNKVVSIGAPLAAFASLAASVMLYVYGPITVRGTINTESLPTELTQSGSTAVTITSFRHDVIALSATGAATTSTAGQNGKYAQARWQNPKTQTASLLSFCLDIYTAASPATTTSCFINNENQAGSGSAIYLFKNKLLNRGHLCFGNAGYSGSNSGSMLPTVGPDEQIKCSNSRGAGTGQNLVGDLDIIYRTSRL